MKKLSKKVKLLPITRSVRKLRDDGWLADIAERKQGPFSKDFLGFADIVALKRLTPYVAGVPAVLLVQATGWTNVSARVKKISESEEAWSCLEAGCTIEVWGWDRYRADPKVVIITEATFDRTSAGSKDE